MRLLIAFWAGLMLWVPALARAEEPLNASYRGIASIYYFLMWVILSYGLYDAFGKKALDIGGPLLAIAIYLVLPAA